MYGYVQNMKPPLDSADKTSIDHTLCWWQFSTYERISLSCKIMKKSAKPLLWDDVDVLKKYRSETCSMRHNNHNKIAVKSQISHATCHVIWLNHSHVVMNRIISAFPSARMIYNVHKANTYLIGGKKNQTHTCTETTRTYRLKERQRHFQAPWRMEYLVHMCEIQFSHTHLREYSKNLREKKC